MRKPRMKILLLLVAALTVGAIFAMTAWSAGGTPATQVVTFRVTVAGYDTSNAKAYELTSATGQANRKEYTLRVTLPLPEDGGFVTAFQNGVTIPTITIDSLRADQSIASTLTLGNATIALVTRSAEAATTTPTEEVVFTSRSLTVG